MKKLLVVLLLSCCTYAYTQEWSIDYSVGYGTFQLNDVKKLQRSMLGSYGLKETDGFSGHITHTVSLGLANGHSYFGAQFSYLTTGGRLDRGDYSGSYTVDMIMNGYRLGGLYRYYIRRGSSPLNFYLQFGSGVLQSNLKIKEQMRIYTESGEETSELKGFGLYAEPSVGATYRLMDCLQLSLGGGYEAELCDKLKYSGQKSEITANWSGFRCYVGLAFMLPTKK